jgi:DNA modification methylase
MMEYEQFLEDKKITVIPCGITVSTEDINPLLFEFQRDIVRWALAKGKAAVFAGTGLGKTGIQLEWANLVNKYTGGDVLILAPLAVAQQTVREGQKFGISVTLCRSQEDVQPGLNIANYEMLHKFDPDKFIGIVLDESSILKSFTGKVRTQIIEMFQHTPYKLACTATPAPNDHMELCNHAEFLGVMTRAEMLAMFFVHDGGNTSQWRLKGHAQDRFWIWVASWAVMLSKPSDLGYEDGAFILPPLNINHVTVLAEGPEAKTLTERREARKNSIDDRVNLCAAIVNQSEDRWIIWCGLNAESELLTKAITDAVEITGSHKSEYKEKSMNDFSEGRIRVLVTKPSICGFGMNWQHCNKMAFVGLSDSFEEYFQAVRRCWRFGQQKPVDVCVITAETEGAVVINIKRKEEEFEAMLSGMIAATQEITKENLQSTGREIAPYETGIETGQGWEMYLGDCVEIARGLEDNSLHYSIFSPPFSSLYTYSNSDRDMGNCKNDDEFMVHFRFLVKELYRIIMPGRLISFHCMDLPLLKQRDGIIGLKDFPALLRQMFEDEGFIFHSKVTIWKDPLVEATRTKALGLLHKQIIKDSAMCRQGLPDYVITMRKPGDNPEPVSHPNGFTTFIGENEPEAPKISRPAPDTDAYDQHKAYNTDPVYSHQVWRRYASPIWMDINQSKTLQRKSARAEEDEKHICPLQLDVIERCLELWSNPGDLVFSPFAGIGSEGYVSLQMGRRFLGVELKKSYYNQACLNLKDAATRGEGKEQCI